MGNSTGTKIASSATEDCLVAWRIAEQQQYFAQQSFRGASFNHHYVPLLASLKKLNTDAVYLFFYMFVNDQLMSGTIITANPNTIVFDINANNYLQPKPTKEATAREQICNLLTYRNIYQQFRI